MIRRFNFTGRKRLARGDVFVRLTKEADGRSGFSASLSLGSYELPADARVFVEAYRQTSWQRFDFGTVGVPTARQRTVLHDFGTAQGVRFRVRVVEPGVHAPRILALVDDLRPLAPPEASGGLSLLPVDWGEFDSQLWMLEIDDESGPLLRVSRRLVPDREAFVGSNEFASLVLPAVLRQILERVLLLEESEGDVGEGWAGEWLKLAREWPGVSAPPERGGSGALTDDEEDWIDEAVRAFGRAGDIPGRFSKWWDEGRA